MPATLRDDLAADLGEFERTLEATRAGRRDHGGCQRQLLLRLAVLRLGARTVSEAYGWRAPDHP